MTFMIGTLKSTILAFSKCTNTLLLTIVIMPHNRSPNLLTENVPLTNISPQAFLKIFHGFCSVFINLLEAEDQPE
jgi:hypothetical protein